MRGTLVQTSYNLTQAELYARALTLRKPTRRSTAQRRQTSTVPATRFAQVSVQDSSTGTSLGNLVFTGSGSTWEVSNSASSSNLKNTGSNAAVQTQQQLVWRDVPTDPYTNFGIGQCASGDPTDLGPGSSAKHTQLRYALFPLYISQDQPTPKVPGGSTPTTVASNLIPGGTGLAETGVWTLDFGTNVATPQWINTDGTTPTTIIAVNTATGTLYVTGDVSAASQALGVSLTPISLSFTIST
ncbi:hypothetical protein CPB84DRAFT_1847842 [Gymnopilus junonius]|uniref:Uncharacterized protein n=1 Tax=Gymnopilus junonius TaxID=109634 RepID=A0A9P5NMZ2_GYMJU|nr:hypothetical protein CPB84DRAFT_1847842 [Gymnopilus junonius]